MIKPCCGEEIKPKKFVNGFAYCWECKTTLMLFAKRIVVVDL